MKTLQKPIAEELIELKTRTCWGWERMSREFGRVMNRPGPAHTTLLRYGAGTVVPSSEMYSRYVREAIRRITLELAEEEDYWKQPS